MNIHKILNGEGAEQYLPFALSKLHQFELLARTVVVQKYQIDDAKIIIEYNPQANQHHIRIDKVGGTLGYEFFTTHDFIDAFPVAWWATSVVPLPPESEEKLRPQRLSTAFTGAPAPIVPRDPMARAINGQRNAEYHWWPSSDGVAAESAIRTKSHFMTSANGCFSWQATDMDYQNFMGSYTTIDGMTATPNDFLPDVGVDVTPTIYEKSAVKTGFPFPILPNWPRRAAYMEVEGRRFVIMSDAQSNFYAYPASYTAASPVFNAIPNSLVRRVKPESYMPVGVAIPTMDTMRIAPRGAITEYGGDKWSVPPAQPYPVLAPYSDNPSSQIEPGADEVRQFQSHHYLWDFHPSGTRAVAVVHLSKNNGYPVLLKGSGTTGETVKCLREYGPQYQIEADDATRPWVLSAGGTSAFDVCKRGVLEVEFNIHITGEAEDAFLFSVTTRRIIDNYWFFDAAYAYCDARLEALGVFSGDLLTDEIRLRGTAVGSSGTRPTIYDEFIVTRNHDHIAEVQSFCVSQNRPYQMHQEYRFAEQVAVPTYPGSPPPVYRFSMLETTPVGSNGVARLLSSDLRSMSKVFDQSRDGTPHGLHAVVFGQDRLSSALPYTEADSITQGRGLLPATFLASGSSWLGGDSVAPNSMDAAHSLGLHRVAWDHITYRYGFDSSVSTGICTHPDGHFAVFAHYKNPYNPDAPVQPFDLIEYRRVVVNEQGEKVERFDRTTHREALLKAFGVSFDLAEFVTAINSDKPIVMQRFASWRNIKMPKVASGQGVFALNPNLKGVP